MKTLVLPYLLPFVLLGGDKPLSPAQALKSFQHEKGIRIELAASEPQLRDPVAMCFDSEGRMLVVESQGYPFLSGENKKMPKLGAIALLEDGDGDGLFEKRTTFANGFTFPNGILPWKGGAFVTCAPDIWYLKDTSGDGRADVRQVVLTGFGTKSSSEQLRVASPTLGPDGWVYVTSGLTDANVTSPLHPDRKPVVSKRKDGRFHPETFVYEPLAGVGQFGQCFDAAGNRFVSSNRNPLMHVVVAPGLLGGNPHYPFTDTVENVVPIAAKVYPLSPDTTAASYHARLLSQQHAGTYTSASGIVIRGSDAFICEPAQNLVQRQVLTPAGATFTSAHPTPGKDFLATPDQWFRPVHATVGPDGALYICDMVRQYIDHPRYLPEDVRAKLPFKAGTEHGRIWRIKLNTPAPPKPTTAQQSAARQNLAIRQGQFPKTPVKALLKQARSKNATTRFLATLQLAGQNHEDKPAGLASVLAATGHDRWLRAAVFSAAENAASGLLNHLAANPQRAHGDTLKSLGRIIGKGRPQQELLSLLQQHFGANAPWPIASQIALLTGLADGVHGRNFSGPEKANILVLPKSHPEALANINLVFVAARKSARANDTSGDERKRAIELLGYSTYAIDGSTLLDLLDPSQSTETQITAVGALRQLGSLIATQALMQPMRWNGFTPEVREAVLGMATSRASFHEPLVQALEKAIIPVHALTPARRRALERNKAIGDRAKKLFALSAGSDRLKAYESSKVVLKMKGVSANGQKVFTRTCATCHTHNGQGHAVGPDLTGLRNQPAEALLLHIIVPNQEVYPQYTLYEVDTRDGQTFAGLLSAETSAQISLNLPLGLSKNIARKNIKALRAHPQSLMPDLLEKAMTKQELADLLTFLKK
jgi:putative membrane-bound dehydrogenase-like protein